MPVAKSRGGRVEIVLLTIAWIAFFLPLIWIVTPVFEFADYQRYPTPFFSGVLCLAFGLWLFYRVKGQVSGTVSSGKRFRTPPRAPASAACISLFASG